jgi:ubiquinone/menaquinone biosynthesis C-methylase UbiE
MDQSKEFLSQLFTKVSKGFDQTGPRFFSYFGELLVNFSDIKEGFKVLDVGCGRGASLIPAAKRVGKLGKVVGIDIAKGMIAELEKDVERLKLNNVELFVVDVEKLELIDEFDIILCGFSITSFPDVKAVFDKLRKVLKPGGKVAVSNWHKNAHNGWDWMSKAIGDHVTKENPLLKTNGVGYEFDTAETMTEFLEKMGLTNIEVKVYEKLFYYKDKEQWWQTSLNNGMRGVLDRMNDKSLEDFRKAAFKELTQMKTEHGIPYPAKVILSSGN